jgi:hypothetical protein
MKGREPKDEFVPQEEAQALKQLGFTAHCFAYYNMDHVFKSPILILGRPFEHDWCLPAPLWQQAFWFILEKYDLSVESLRYAVNKWDIAVTSTRGEACEFSTGPMVNSRPEALLKGLQEAIKVAQTIERIKKEVP